MSPGNGEYIRFKRSGLLTSLFASLSIAGSISFVAGILGPDPLRAWQTYLINFLFWSGLSFGAIVFVAVLNVTGALWARPVKRLAEAFSAFLPVAFLLFCILYFGREELFPWIREPASAKAAWLNVSFLFFRDGISLAILTAISLTLVFLSVNSDYYVDTHRVNGGISTGKTHTQSPPAANWRRQKIVSVILIVAYSFVLTLIAFDLVMSLDPHWYSTLFGAYYFVGCFYTAVSALYLLAFVTQNTWKPENYQGLRHFHDFGKLTLAFCLFTGYLFYSQFLTIWYGNLPEETRYVILRVKLTYWEPLAWIIFCMIFLIPFLVLLFRKIKVKRMPMILLSGLILTGMWLERLILVAPSLWPHETFPLGLTELFITAGFFGVVALCFRWFMARVPLLPISDPLFRDLLAKREPRLEP